MPEKSHFTGLDPPTDALKWDQAIEDVCSGKLILLQQVLHVVGNRSGDIYSGGTSHSWSHNLGDKHVINGQKIKNIVNDYYNENGGSGSGSGRSSTGTVSSTVSNSNSNVRAPIIHLGHRMIKEDGSPGFKEYVSKNICEYNEKVSGKMIVIGCMDSNWGYLSTNMLNRSVYWKEHLGPGGRKGLSSQQLLQGFLDNPSLLMMLVSGHHNISHPKLVSMPLGPTDAKQCVRVGNMVKQGNLKNPNSYRKHVVLLTAGSNWKFRPAIRECVSRGMGNEMYTIRKKIKPVKFLIKVIESLGVLCMPGLGYDSYRIWETLLMGAMPVIERGCGMDKTFWKLPVLTVDDFADVTPELVHSAYVEALYRRDHWDYRRLLRSFWKEVVYGVAEAKNNDLLMDLFPMKAEDTGFTRPAFPFNCEKMGGCGPGTKRTPAKYCAIDTTLDYNKFSYY